jgi:hypothetical protein
MATERGGNFSLRFKKKKSTKKSKQTNKGLSTSFKQKILMLISTTIVHEARKKLNLSWTEYGTADLIWKLSPGDRWCDMSRENMGKEIGISHAGMCKLVDRLVEKGVVIKNGKGGLRTTEKWYETVVFSRKNAADFF